MKTRDERFLKEGWRMSILINSDKYILHLHGFLLQLYVRGISDWISIRGNFEPDTKLLVFRLLLMLITLSWMAHVQRSKHLFKIN